MIPILYAGNETNFTSNGLGRLSDAIKCTVEEERNGIFELEMTYPITGIHFDDIAENNIILARSEDGGTPQAFIIYKISKPLNGIVTINAQHISYLLNGYVVMPFTASSLADALIKLNSNAVVTTGFTFYTDIVNSKQFNLEIPKTIRSVLGGESGSLLENYGSFDYQFDNFTVKLLASRGNDNHVTIRYGKNLTDLKAVTNTTNIYTGIVPFWADSEGNTVYVQDYVVYSEHAQDYPHKYIKVVDFSSEFETQPTQAQLLTRAQSYLSNNNGWKIKNNIDVSFIDLASTEEYKNIAPLERVKLCDTVTVEYLKLGVSFKTKVIRTVYNVLLDRYDSIELGDTTYSLAKAIQEVNDTPTVEETTSFIQAAVDNATKLIRGGYGGHVVMMADANGKPQEILIMDTDDITTAQKVWRWNLNGLGYSSTGYDGTYGTAITMNGAIVADYITTGTLNAGVIKAGILSDGAGKNSWNLLTGDFSLQAGVTVGGYTVNQIAASEAGSTLSTWITNTYNIDKQNIEGQIDGKAETWYQSADPSSAWTTSSEKSKHVGDLWYKTTDDTTWYYSYDSDTQTYSWEQQNVPQAVFDKIDGKAQIFLSQPTVPYYEGDLWCQGSNGDILSCTTTRTTGSYTASDWTKQNDYVDSNDVSSAISAYDTSLNQTKIFNKLTNNGAIQGIFMQNGQLYVNASYIATGILADPSSKTQFNLSTGALTTENFTVTANNFTLDSTGNLTATGATFYDVTIESSALTGSGVNISESEITFNYNGTEIASLVAARGSYRDKNGNIKYANGVEITSDDNITLTATGDMLLNASDVYVNGTHMDFCDSTGGDTDDRSIAPINNFDFDLTSWATLYGTYISYDYDYDAYIILGTGYDGYYGDDSMLLVTGFILNNVARIPVWTA